MSSLNVLVTQTAFTALEQRAQVPSLPWIKSGLKRWVYARLKKFKPFALRWLTNGMSLRIFAELPCADFQQHLFSSVNKWIQIKRYYITDCRLLIATSPQTVWKWLLPSLAPCKVVEVHCTDKYKQESWDSEDVSSSIKTKRISLDQMRLTWPSDTFGVFGVLLSYSFYSRSSAFWCYGFQGLLKLE